LEIIILILVVLAMTVLLFPKQGLVGQLKKHKQERERILLEDTLKHLYDYEFNNTDFSVVTLAKYLSVSSERSEGLLDKLKSLGLLIKQKDKSILSPEGKAYALQIIRIHRLLENYLAEKTSLESTEWHKKADEVEHNIAPSEADALAAKMGNPLFDPHGDPIPFNNGEVLPMKGKPMLEMDAETFAQIIHIEDEPIETYSQIAALQLYPGLNIQIIKKENNNFIVKANGKEILLPALLASNITVAKIDKNEVIDESFETLTSLNTGEEAEVVGIAKTCRGQQRRRLLDFGVVPGSKIKAELKSLGGNPVAYNICGALIALRNENAEQIFIRKRKKEKV